MFCGAKLRCAWEATLDPWELADGTDGIWSFPTQARSCPSTPEFAPHSVPLVTYSYLFHHGWSLVPYDAMLFYPDGPILDSIEHVLYCSYSSTRWPKALTHSTLAICQTLLYHAMPCHSILHARWSASLVTNNNTVDYYRKLLAAIGPIDAKTTRRCRKSCQGGLLSQSAESAK